MLDRQKIKALLNSKQFLFFAAILFGCQAKFLAGSPRKQTLIRNGEGIQLFSTI
jgi:hypothetical protein